MKTFSIFILIFALEIAAEAQQVSGTLTLDGKTYNITAVLAKTAENPLDRARKDVQILLTDVPVSESDFNHRAMNTLATEGKLHGILAVIDDTKSVRDLFVLGYVQKTGGHACEFEPREFSLQTASGKLYNKNEEESFGHTYQFSVDFDTPVKDAVIPMVDEKSGKPLPAGGGDVGKAYMEFDKAVRTGNVAVMKQFAADEKQAAMLDDPEMKEMIDLMKDLRATNLKITKGFTDGNRATLFVEGVAPSTGGAQKGTIRMLKVGKSWKLEKEQWEASSLPAPGKAVSASGNKVDETMTNMSSIAKAIAEYGRNNNMAYPKDEKELAASLVPKSLEKWPMNDGWGNPFKYACCTDTDDFVIVSYGADGKPDEGLYDSNGLPTFTAMKQTKDPNADIIFVIDFPLQSPAFE